MIAWLSLPRESLGPASPIPSARSRSVVGHMQIVVPLRSSSMCVAWIAVEFGPSAPTESSSRIGVMPVAARHASFSARCSETWKCSGLPCANSTTTGIWSTGTARTEWIAAPTFAPLIALTRSAHLCASPSLKRCWASFGGSPNPPAR